MSEKRKVSYILQPVIEGSVVSNSIKCRLPPNQKTFFIFSKRKELIFFEITESGIKASFNVPFPKTIVSLNIITSKSLGKPKGSDMIVVLFYDFSFIVFNDPKKIKYQYVPKNNDYDPNLVYLCETHSIQPILFTYSKSGHLTYWNAIDNPKKVFNISIADQKVLDLKFLPHQTIRLSILYNNNAGSCSVTTYTFNKRILTLEELPRLTVRLLADPTSKFIVPFPHGDHTKPVFLVVGTDIITLVFKTSVSNIDSPFEKSEPKCYFDLGGRSILIGTSSGDIFGFSFDDNSNFIKIGNVPTIPTSITKIDGNIFFFGSSIGNSMFVQLSNSDITILNIIEQFTPVNSFSSFCEDTGTIFITQGNERMSSISSLKTGAVFIKEAEINIPLIESIYSAQNNLIVVTLRNCRSICINSETYEIATIDRFMENAKTLNIIPRNKKSFFQITSQIIRVVGNETNNLAITYDSNILFSTTDGNNILLLFSDYAEIVSMDLEPLTQLHFQNSSAFTAALYQGMAAVVFYTGMIQLLSTNDTINSTVIDENELITAIHFVVEKNNIMLILFSESGVVIRLDVPDLQEISRVALGYHINSVTYLKETCSFLINGTSPTIFYPNGSFISVVCDNYLTSCSLGNYRYALATDSNLLIGIINESNNCSIESRNCTSCPLLFCIHKQPLSLFVSFETKSKFSLSGFILPSFSETFSHDLSSAQEEITSLYYCNEINATLVGIATNKDGSLLLIKELLGEFKIIQTVKVDGSVFSISSSVTNPNHIIVGGFCKVMIFKAIISFTGLIEMETIQVIPTNAIPISISVLGPFIIYFGANRSIVVLRESNDGMLTKYDERIIKMELRAGFIGRPVSKHSCHMFTVDSQNNLTISLFKFEDDSIAISDLTTYKLESPITSFNIIRNGFALIATRNGMLLCLHEYDREKASILKKISLNISSKLPAFSKVQKKTKIIDGSLLDYFSKFSKEIQEEISKSVSKKPKEVNLEIQNLKHTTAKMCSTLDVA